MKKNRLLLLITILLLSLNATGAKKQIIINSNNLGCNDTVIIHTPTGYNGESLPALFLLHGWSGNWKNWSDKADLQQISDKFGFIIITPDGFYNSWYVNSVVPQGMQWRSFFNDELYPLIHKEYNLDPDKTFITGLSMGGHGAINLFLDDITRFRAAGSMSGVLNLEDTRLKSTEMVKVLGPYTPENLNYKNESAINRLDNFTSQANSDKHLRERVIIVSCGKSDGLLKSSVNFAEKCDSIGLKNILILSPGNHTWNHWVYSLETHLLHFQRLAKGEHLGY